MGLLGNVARAYVYGRMLRGQRRRRQGWSRHPYQPRRRQRGGFFGPFPYYSTRTRRGSHVTVSGCCLPIPLGRWRPPRWPAAACCAARSGPLRPHPGALRAKSLHPPDVARALAAHHRRMLMTGSPTIDAERAFARALRARRRAALGRRLLGGRSDDGRLAVIGEHALRGSGRRSEHGLRAIPVGAIDGTLEPSRAGLFDRCFRPSAGARARWQRLWLAEQRGAVLPPITVVPIGDRYAVRDGHHRVSVAKARGALTIDAAVGAVAA